jgi:hypothetical protein
MGHFFNKKYVCVQPDPRTTRNNQLFCYSLTKKILPSYSDNMRNDRQIQISSEIKFILKNNLGYESGDRVCVVDERKNKLKISCKYTFKPY